MVEAKVPLLWIQSRLTIVLPLPRMEGVIHAFSGGQVSTPANATAVIGSPISIPGIPKDDDLAFLKRPDGQG